MPDLAFASEADFIVTWDPHLLDHEIPLPVEVVTPAQLLQRLRTDGP
jgi:predicted nucleic acid-binding protein